jgi:putative ABC transport system substrate-binding protein
MNRREIITLLGGAVTAWPLSAHAQQGNRVRRIGVLIGGDENDPLMKAYLSAFTQALAGLGWSDGRNVRMDLRWFGDDINRIRALAHELVGLQPDIILTNGGAATVAVQRETQTIPIVFASVVDPVASGIVARLNQPGGNVTGFASLEASLGGKWLELLSEVAPGLKRAAIMFNPDLPPVSAYMPSFETAARSLKIEPIIAPVHDDVEIEMAIISLGREPGGGLVVISDAFTNAHSAAIISAAARNNVPAVYRASEFARDGGLLSYGNDQVDSFRRAASYVDRILRGEKPLHCTKSRRDPGTADMTDGLSGVNSGAHDPQRLFDLGFGCKHSSGNLVLVASAHSALNPASLMIGHHFSASALTNAPSAAGVCCSRGKTSSPRSASRDRTAGSARASTAAALSLPMMSFGVPLGAKRPYHADQETLGNPSSAKVGISGAAVRRVSLVVA